MPEMVKLYDGEIRGSERLSVLLSVGNVEISAGDPYLVATSDSTPLGTVKISNSGSETRITGHCCNLEISYPKDASLLIDVGTGNANIREMSPAKRFVFKTTTGVARFKLHDLLKTAVRAEAETGTVIGSIGYAKKGVDSDLRLVIGTGTLDVELQLPKNVALKTNLESESRAGILKLPEEQEGKNGRVRLSAKPGTGVFKVSVRRVN